MEGVSSNSRTFSRMAVAGLTNKNANMFKIYVRLLDTGEKFAVKNAAQDLSIKKLKEIIEFTAGVPTHLQRLTYLDEGELIDSTDIKHNDIVPGGTVNLRVWNQWANVLEAVAANDIDELTRIGVAPGAAYSTPVVDYMTKRAREANLKERAFVALFIAAHRGHKRMVEKLVEGGADVNASTPLGRTALHVATAAGHGTIVDTLLDSGAGIDAVDSFGESALTISAKFNQKDCERHLFLWRWQQRADAVKSMKKLGERERFAHQYFDSGQRVWLEGDQAQIYLTNILPPGEFEGTGFSASKRKPLKKRFEEDSDEDVEEDEEEEEEEEVQEELDLLGEKQDKPKASSSRRSVKGVSTLEPIEEQSIGSRTPPSSAKPKKEMKKKKVKGGKAKVPSFDDWLKQKEYIDHVKSVQRRLEKAEQKWKAEQKKQETEAGTKSYDAWMKEREKEKKLVRQKEMGASSKAEVTPRYEKRERHSKEPEEYKPDINELRSMFGTVLGRSPSPARVFIRQEESSIMASIKSAKAKLLPS